MSPEPWTKKGIHKFKMSPIRRTRNPEDTKPQTSERHWALAVSRGALVSLHTESGAHSHCCAGRGIRGCSAHSVRLAYSELTGEWEALHQHRADAQGSGRPAPHSCKGTHQKIRHKAHCETRKLYPQGRQDGPAINVYIKFQTIQHQYPQPARTKRDHSTATLHDEHSGESGARQAARYDGHSVALN